MKGPLPVFVIVWMISLCGITAAQDRGTASSIAWSPDGETIAVGSTTGIWFFDNEFNEQGYVEIESSGQSRGPERFVEWNAGSDLLAVSSILEVDDPKQIRIIDVAKLEVITEIETKSSVLWTEVLWNPEGNLVIAGEYHSGIARIWDALTGEELFYFDVDEKDDLNMPEITGFCWFTENTVIAVNTHALYVVDIAENTILRFGHYGAFEWSSCNRDYQIITIYGRLIHLQTGLYTRKLFHDADDDDIPYYAMAVAWSPESGHFAVSSEGCLVRVFDGQSGELVVKLPGSIRIVSPNPWFFLDSIAWHPDGSRFAVVGQFGDIRVWDAETYELLRRFDGFEVHPGSLEWWFDTSTPLSEVECP